MELRELHNILASLSIERPVFHSEADFQFSLAWAIKLADQRREIRLERRFPGIERRMSLDLQVIDNSAKTNIELKYITAQANIEYRGELYELKEATAFDQARYDFLKDIQRLETLNSLYSGATGYAVMLNCNRTMEAPGRSSDVIDGEFRIHEGESLTGRLQWSPRAGAGSIKGRESPIVLQDRYSMNWRPFSVIQPLEFNYLAVKVADGA
jgi:hypothetical protein